jgi:hypothetical protein
MGEKNEMTKKPTRFQLKDKDHNQQRRFLAGTSVSLGENTKSTWVTLLRQGSFYHPQHGNFDVTKELLEGFIRNFEARTYGQDIFIDVAHEPQKGAAGEIKKLSVEGGRLRAFVEWTQYGIKAIKEKGFKYLSADYWDNYTDNEQRLEHGPLLAGAGLVTRPHIKRMDPVTLSEYDDSIVIIDPKFAKKLIEEAQKTMKKHLLALTASLATMKLNEATQKQLGEQFEVQAKNLGDDEKALKSLQQSFETLGSSIVKQLAEAGKPADAPANITIQLAEAATNGKSLAEQIQQAIDARDAATAKKLAEDNSSLSAKKKIFSDALDAATGLSDSTKKSLTESVDGLITLNITDEQVTKLAESQITLGNQMEANKKLSEMGYQFNGTPHVVVGGDQSSMRLQETMNNHLKGTSAYANKRLKLLEDKEINGFVKVVLSEFDRIHGARMMQENKVLAGEETMIADTSLPVGVQRTVIMEALSDLRVLELVQTLTDPSAQATTQIPYEVRDTSGVLNGGVVFEGQGIRAASVQQKMDLAYILPKKLAMKLSNEVIHFTRASAINWDAMARNIQSNARVMRELLMALIANEIQRTSDAWNAVAVTAEDVATRLDGSESMIKTVNFPVVRPHQDYTLDGTTIGSVKNGITLVLDATTITAYDGSGTQASGTYYVLTSLNLGYISLVSELGVAVTPSVTTGTIAYSYATNVVKWDIDLPASTTLETHLNKLLQAVGARKAVMNQDRYISPEFLLMSPTLNDTITNASQFERDSQKSGTSQTASGDLATIKALPSFGTNAPGIDLGDERIHMGQRGTTSYVIAKPYMMGQPFEAVDSNGRATGEKMAYGEEYSAIHTPLSIRNRGTGIIVYSADARTAA